MKKLELELDDEIYEMLEKDREEFKKETNIELTMEQEAIAVIYAYMKVKSDAINENGKN